MHLLWLLSKRCAVIEKQCVHAVGGAENVLVVDDGPAADESTAAGEDGLDAQLHLPRPRVRHRRLTAHNTRLVRHYRRPAALLLRPQHPAPQQRTYTTTHTLI